MCEKLLLEREKAVNKVHSELRRERDKDDQQKNEVLSRKDKEL